MANNIQKIENDIHEHRSNQEQSQKDIFAALQKLENQVALNLSELHHQNQENIHTALYKLDQDIESIHNLTKQIISALPQQNQLPSIPQNQDFVTSTVIYDSVVTATEDSVTQADDDVAPTEDNIISTTENNSDAFTENGVSTKEDSVSSTENSVSPTTTSLPLSPDQASFPSCKDVPSNVSGIYQIALDNVSVPFKVFCEQQAYGGGWIVIQHRYDGSLDLYRDWDEFSSGFGDLEKEFWLGLEKVHQITQGRNHELIVELKNFDGIYKYARYDAFEIGSESNQYVLKLGSYSGTAGDGMDYDRGMKFTTKDRDHDISIAQCAHFHEGAWWHKRCTYANLNGRYINALDDKSMNWWDFNKNRQGLSYSKMMIRELA